jgi:hypothetical protein
MVKQPTKATYASRAKKPVASKEPTPSLSDDETHPDPSLAGQLLDINEEPNPPSKTRGEAKPKATTTKAKTPAKPTTTPITKKVVPSLPSSDKVVSKIKSTQSKPKPLPKAQKGHDSDSEFDTDAEEEKVISKSKEKEDKKQAKVRPTRGKADSSKLPSSNDSSTKSKSSTDSKTSSSRSPTKKEDVPTLPSLPSPPLPPANDAEEEDDYGPDLNSDELEAIENVEALSSSPDKLKKGEQVPPLPVDKDMSVDQEEEQELVRPEAGSRSKSKSVSKSKSNSPELSDLDDENQVPDISETKVDAEDQFLSDRIDKMDQDEDEEEGEEDKDESMGEEEVVPQPENQSTTSRSQKSAMKRLAEYDTNAVSDSAGLLLEEMSPAKKPRLSASSTKSVKISDTQQAKTIPKPPAEAPAKSTPKTPRGKKNTAPAEALPPIDYIAMVAQAGYGKELIKRLLAKKAEQEKKCDWYELSIELRDEGVRRFVDGTGKKAKKGKEVISGNDLHDLFHDVSHFVVQED